MAIQIDSHDGDEVTTIQVQGELDFLGANELRELLKTLATEAPGKRIVLDVSQVPFIDSHGLMALVSGQKAIRQHNGELILSGVGPQVRRVFQLTMLDRIFTFVDSGP